MKIGKEEYATFACITDEVKEAIILLKISLNLELEIRNISIKLEAWCLDVITKAISLHIITSENVRTQFLRIYY